MMDILNKFSATLKNNHQMNKFNILLILSQLGLFFYLTENGTTKSWEQIDCSLAYKVGLPPLKYKMKTN